ncbi:hypothetical protein [Levilactobacillus sp. N40-8-2]|uniref:hypothetical protein n=1 Tax=Levilactobacillus muriae TaxID=3238987 RepID=UPI0038B3527A
MEFEFKNGVHGFSRRLNQVVDHLDATEIALIETLLDIAVAPEQPVTVKAIREKLGITATELSFYLSRLVHLDLITWTPDEASIVTN